MVNFAARGMTAQIYESAKSARAKTTQMSKMQATKSNIKAQNESLKQRLSAKKQRGDKIYRPHRRKFIGRYSPIVSASSVPPSMLLIKETVAKRAAGKFMSVCGALGKSKTIAFFLSP